MSKVSENPSRKIFRVREGERGSTPQDFRIGNSQNFRNCPQYYVLGYIDICVKVSKQVDKAKDALGLDWL